MLSRGKLARQVIEIIDTKKLKHMHWAKRAQSEFLIRHLPNYGQALAKTNVAAVFVVDGEEKMEMKSQNHQKHERKTKMGRK
jgi:hypothetical protein